MRKFLGSEHYSLNCIFVQGKSTLYKAMCIATLFLLVSCGGGGSSTGVVESLPGQNLPANFVGVYRGTVTARIDSDIGGRTSTSDLVATVMSNGTILFEVEGETFTAGVTDTGEFSGNLQSNEDDCDPAIVAVVGRVDGTTASGTLSGHTECKVSGLTVDVELTGSFLATK